MKYTNKYIVFFLKTRIVIICDKGNEKYCTIDIMSKYY